MPDIFRFRDVIVGPLDKPRFDVYYGGACLGTDAPRVVDIARLQRVAAPSIWLIAAAESRELRREIDRVPVIVVDRYCDIEPFTGTLERALSPECDKTQGRCADGGPCNGHEVEFGWDERDKLSVIEYDSLRKLSREHDVWWCAHLNPVGYMDSLAAATHDDSHYSRSAVRALAAAYGLGPTPDWMAPILPALIVIDERATAMRIDAYHDAGDLATPYTDKQDDVLRRVAADARDIGDTALEWCCNRVREALDCPSKLPTSQPIVDMLLDRTAL